MLLFRDEEHVDRWCRARELSRGAILAPQQGWPLAQGWFQHKLRPDWKRRTGAETEALLAEIGLQGDFWKLG